MITIHNQKEKYIFQSNPYHRTGELLLGSIEFVLYPDNSIQKYLRKDNYLSSKKNIDYENIKIINQDLLESIQLNFLHSYDKISLYSSKFGMTGKLIKIDKLQMLKK